METVIMPSWEEVKELLPKRTSLYYVDYNDSLDDHLDLLQECIENGEYDTLYSAIDDWYIDSPCYAFEYLDKELADDICRKFDIGDAEEIMEEYEQEIRDEYYNRDDSDVLKDLLRNTGKQTMFYDTGIEIDSDSWQWNREKIAKTRNFIKKSLKIKCSKRQNRLIDTMLCQASYGGSLVIYFYDDVSDFIETTQNTITFKNPVIAIIDTVNGSGDHCELGKVGEIEMPFNRERIRLCKTIKYSYTFSVCGMYSDWCEDTIVGLKDTVITKVLGESALSLKLQKDAKYSEVFKSGSCSFGDVDFNRHRNVIYRNDYPAGHTCKDCGTFWID